MNFTFTVIMKEKNLGQNQVVTDTARTYNGIEFEGEGVLPEEESSALWFEEYVGYESRVIGDSSHSRSVLSSVTPMKYMGAESIIYDKDLTQVFIIERYSLWSIMMYEGPHGYYGGDVKDITLGISEINSHFFQDGILRDYSLRSLYIEGFEVEYILTSHTFNDDEQVFLLIVDENNYSIYNNELYEFYYYNNYE